MSTNAKGYEAELDTGKQGLVEADLSPEIINVIRRHDELLRELDDRTLQKTADASRKAYEILFGRAWVERVIEAPFNEKQMQETERKSQEWQSQQPKGEFEVVDTHVSMSLEGIRDSGRCTDQEYQRMAVMPSSRKREFVRYRAGLPVGTMQAESHEFATAAANRIFKPRR